MERGRYVRRMSQAAAWVLIAAAASPGAPPSFPVKAGEGGRYLVDSRGKPFLYWADTAWNLPKKLTLKEAEQYFDDRVAKGFTAIQIQAVSKEQGPPANRAGHNPFTPLHDILKPNERYWQHLDQVIESAWKRGLMLGVAPLWIRWGGEDKEGWRGQLTEANARAYGRFLGERYGRFGHLMWILGGDANPGDKTGAINELAAGIREKAPAHLLTVHNAPEHSSARWFNDEKWLDVNLAYTYGEVHGHILPEYVRVPARPIILGESGYEQEDNDKRGGEPYRMRRQACGAVLSGAIGGHAFGQKHVWRCDRDWRKSLNSPATRQMVMLKQVIGSRPWHRLVPDLQGAFVVEGKGKVGDVDYVSAAVADDGSFAMAYLPAGRKITVDLGRMRGRANALWFDPTDGSSRSAAEIQARARYPLEPPAKNNAGEPDFLLLIDTE